MKERPILFSGPMVRAILEGRKTVTRRVMSPQPDHAQIHVWNGRTICECESRAWCWRDRVFHDANVDCHGTNTLGPMLAPFCPHGAPGDRLWVRETMKRVDSGLRSEVWTYDADGVPVMLPRDDPRVPAMIAWAHHKKGSTCVSIHMPRWASRITLDVVSVRAERLQDITDEDIAREGVDRDALAHLGLKDPIADDLLPVTVFAMGWNAINGKRAPWASNPWVWRVEFRRIELEARGG